MHDMRQLIVTHAPRQQMLERLVAICTAPRDVKCLYFGCIGRSGHALWEGGGKYLGHHAQRQRDIEAAFTCSLDTHLCWNGQQDPYRRDESEGRALVTHGAKWTALAFWDRSADSRPGSNSVFLASGQFTFSQMIRLARHRWPMVWDRFKFEIVEVDRNGRPVQQ